MGALGKTIGIGIGVLFVGTAALEAIGQNLKHEFTESEVAAAASESAQIASEAAADAAKATVEASRFAGAPPSKSEKLSSSQHGPIKLASLNAAERQLRHLINLSGNLCAKPVEVRPVGGDLYGVSCVTNRDGSGQSNYLVNSHTNEVTEI